ncbi:MAG: DUF1329 domain-containing protein [Deltaproteobacteria bacterium]|nr:DUF1329 domain-containing protein [Deltaproteobacteria bacterium]
MTKTAKWIAIPAVAAALFAGVWSASAQEPIARANWGAAVGFTPALDVPNLSAGMTVDAGNLDGFTSVVPEPIRILVSKYKLKIRVRDYAAYAPSDGYIKATNDHRGKARLVDIGAAWDKEGLDGYVAGLPFPQPKDGNELAWDFYYNYHGDDGRNEFAVYWVSAKRGVERHEVWRWTYIINTLHRTDIPPMPRLDRLADKDIAATSLTETLFPLDRKGQLALYNVYDNPTDREGWVYIPAQRRTMRFTSDNHGEAWNNTDLMYEDIRGYSGRPEWMEWKILEKPPCSRRWVRMSRWAKTRWKKNLRLQERAALEPDDGLATSARLRRRTNA